RPDRVKAQPVGLLDGLGAAGRRAARPIAEAQAESQVTRHGWLEPTAHRPGAARAPRADVRAARDEAPAGAAWPPIRRGWAAARPCAPSARTRYGHGGVEPNPPRG